MKDWYKILLVDDEPDTLKPYYNLFTRHGFAVDMAHNVIEAWEKLHQNLFGVAILDERMPLKGDGLGLAKRIYDKQMDTDIIILTAYENKEAVDFFNRTIIKQWFEKSTVDFETILTAVKNLFTARSHRWVVYVEGKTDELILDTAWRKLYPKQMRPYVIQRCDTDPENLHGGAGGVNTLDSRIRSGPVGEQRIVIGIFDRDKEGCRKYNNLPKSFTEETVAKVSAQRKSMAFLLPIPLGKEGYAKYNNLCLEFYFNDSALFQRTENGQGLDFDYYEEITLINEVEKERKRSILPEARKIKDGKTIFAEQIVPVLPASEFESFRLIFEQIEMLLN